ncbi:MFS transporter [Shinella sp. DD12]|uniref:MFS transporter n=1 Tax=Shinella sp. DD12 TaxID=1410620 RepID=UPI000437C5D3|nr:MFS transporter [Shinella sp. DD12]EYR83771.1 putative membrane protein [Shinella sp. DD12]
MQSGEASSESTARRNIPVLTIAQMLGASGGPIIIALGGLIGQSLAPSPFLFTLPVFTYTLAMALGTLPAAWLMRRWGRPCAYLIGASIGVIGGTIATLALFMSSFWLFCLGTFGAGFYASYVQSYRFAGTDGVPRERHARAISWIMVGGLLAAILGPQLVILTRDMAPGVPFAGAFASQTILAALAILVLTRLRPVESHSVVSQTDGEVRSTGAFLRTPRYMLAVATGIVSYALMNLMMTAAPMAMVGCGISIDDATLGIQWHALAMFAPSFLTGRLIERFGAERVAAVGLLLIGGAAVVALFGLEVGHFWGSLILLGIGWNFGFIGATAMLASTHQLEERTRAQGLNDFLVFGSVAIASLSSGPVLNSSGWALLNTLVFPIVALVLVPLLWSWRRNT